MEATMSGTHLQVTRNEDVVVVHFVDRKLAGDLPNQVGAELLNVAAQSDCMRLLVSFAGVDFLASDMLGKVVQLNSRMKKKGGRLTLCEICPYLRQVFVTTKLDLLIAIKNSEAEGLAACA
jgi:anti-anti-sigma factor